MTRGIVSNMQEPEFLLVDEVAALLRVSSMTIYRLVKRRELGAVKVGDSIRIPRAAVEEYLAQPVQPEVTT